MLFFGSSPFSPLEGRQHMIFELHVNLHIFNLQENAPTNLGFSWKCPGLSKQDVNMYMYMYVYVYVYVHVYIYIVVFIIEYHRHIVYKIKTICLNQQPFGYRDDCILLTSGGCYLKLDTILIHVLHVFPTSTNCTVPMDHTRKQMDDMSKIKRMIQG